MSRRYQPIPLADADIRPALMRWLGTCVAEGDDTVLLEELGICQGRARVDIALVKAIIHGYEIKSDRDSLARLLGQAAVYSKVLDRVTLVVGERHQADAMALVPQWWAVMLATTTAEGVSFEVCRSGTENPRREARALAELLWLQDALTLLEARDLANGLRGKPRRMVWDRLCEHIEVEEIAAAVRTQLKARARMSDPRPSL